MKEFMSDCCSAYIIEDSDFCGDCKDHCGAIDEKGDEYEMKINQWVKTEIE